MFVIIESKNKIKKLIFEALPSARSRAPGKVFSKKNLCRVPHDLAPGKEITKKNKKLFAGCPRGATPGKEIIKKIKKSLPGASRHGTRQRKFEKKIKKSLPGASDMAPGKARDDGAATVTTTFLCRVPGLHLAKSLSGAR